MPHQFDITRPVRLYRYSEAKWLERSLHLGEFRLRPAADYKELEGDRARQDDELVRIRSSPGTNEVITSVATGKQFKPIGEVTYRSEVGTNYLTVCFSKTWDEKLFAHFPNTDACLVIHQVEEFCERMHAAVEAVLPQWAGMDAPVTYGGRSPLGAAFSKPLHLILQDEWRFAWRPAFKLKYIEPVPFCIGNIEKIAEVVRCPSHPSISTHILSTGQLESHTLSPDGIER